MPKVSSASSLKINANFLIYRVVLQNRVVRGPDPALYAATGYRETGAFGGYPPHRPHSPFLAKPLTAA